MLDIGWTEMAVIAVVAIIAIGPKDLPMALKTVGQWVARARGLAREFQNSVDDMIREAELDKVKKEVEEAATKLDVTKDIEASKNELEKSLEMPSIELDPTHTPESPPETPPGASVDKPPEPPVESVAAPPADAPGMPLPSKMDQGAMDQGAMDQPVPAAEPRPESEQPTAPRPQRAAGGPGQ